MVEKMSTNNHLRLKDIVQLKNKIKKQQHKNGGGAIIEPTRKNCSWDTDAPAYCFYFTCN